MALSKYVHSSILSTREKNYDKADLAKPSQESERQTTERTRLALDILKGGQKSNGRKTDPKFVKYTPNSGGSRLVRMQEAAVDPMEPARFRAKKMIRRPPSPPVPILHSPPRKLSNEERQSWRIPPPFSNWKNPKGYTIPLEMREAADGRNLLESSISDSHAKLSESLNVAEKKAREELEIKAKLMEKVAIKQKEQHERELRELAARARERRLNYDSEIANEKKIDEKMGRDEIRRERKRERKREFLSSKRPKRERDVIEQLAIGNTVPISKDTLFDSRLFNQSQGVGSGFRADDEYNIYSKPLFTEVSQHIYRPSDIDSEFYGARDDEGKATKNFTADVGFEGASDNKGIRSGPVQFEKDPSEENTMNKRR